MRSVRRLGNSGKISRLHWCSHIYDLQSALGMIRVINKTPFDGKLATTQEAAEVLGVHKRTVRRWALACLLPGARKVGRQVWVPCPIEHPEVYSDFKTNADE